MKKLFTSIFLCFLIMAQLNATNLDGQKTTYSFKITEVTDLASFKRIRFYLEGMFDAIPTFNDAKDEITVTSDILVDETKFNSKMGNLGYTSIYFRIGESK